MFCLSLLFQLIFAGALGSQKYGLSDLEVLAANREYVEFFAHAKDIRPSQRNEKWRKLVIKLGQSYLDHLRKIKDYKLSSWNEIENISSWTSFKFDDFYQIKRNGYAKSFFEHCFLSEEKQLCIKKIRSFWLNSNKDADTGFHLAKLTSGLLIDDLTWSLVTDIIKSEQGHFYCNKSLITDALTVHLQNLNVEKSTSFQEKVRLQNSATLKCWDKMMPALKSSLTSIPAKESTGLFMALSSLKQLSTLEADLWLTRYLLQKPKVGDLFNQSWNRLKELSLDFQRRKASPCCQRP